MLEVLKKGESLTAVMSGAAATTNPSYSVSGRGQLGLESGSGSLNGTTAVTVQDADNDDVQVDMLRIYNADTAAVTVTVNKVTSAATVPVAKSTIPAGGTLTLSERGIQAVDSSGQLLQTVGDEAGVGTAATNVTSGESRLQIRKTVLTLTDVSLTVANTTGVSFGGTKIYDFPAGVILLLGAVLRDVTIDLTDAGNVTPIAGADGGDMSVGTTAPTDGTLTATDVNIVPSTSIDPISGGISGALLVAPTNLDGASSAALDAFINMLIDDADVGDGASDVLLVSGTVELLWATVADF